MQSKISFKKVLFIVSITAVVYTFAILCLFPVVRGSSSFAKFTPPNRNQITQNPSYNKPIFSVVAIDQNSIGLPIRLKIPIISLDAAIEQAGLKANGEMDVPKDTANVAWFNLGARPGESGSAVIAGHFGILENGEGSVFDDLKKLRKGDRIYIENDKGTNVIFEVRESRNYDADADASGVFNSNDGKSHLNLVTCQGWDKVSESYTKRFVLFTDKE